jgi:hypothetical protein
MSIDAALNRPAGPIPLWVKLAYTAFLAVMVPVYWKNYTAVNFLWFCDVALALALVSMWTEKSLPASMAAIGIVLPQMLWIFDFFDRMLTGGHHLVDLSEYMFDEQLPLFLRGLSLFHGWLPLLLLWLVARLGYDRRAIRWQPLLSAAVLTVSFFLITAPGHPAGNLNKVLGPSDSEIITSMPRWAWLCVLIVLHPLLIHLPSHVVFRRMFRTPEATALPAVA